MQRPTWLLLTSCFLLGCARAGGDIYEFRPTSAPLRYTVSEQGDMLIETPVGEQHSTDSTRATLTLTIGRRGGAGNDVSVTFQALDIWEGGDFEMRHVEGTSLLGTPFTGSLSEDGKITVADGPEIPDQISKVADPVAVFAHLLAPLPPGGVPTTQPWQHSRVSRSQTTVSATTTYEGSARLAGDTVWNGQAAQVIVSEGTSTTTGRGMPVGAPGEVEFTLSGRSTTRYIWDPDRGVMLASSSSPSADGDLDIPSMGMTMPIAYQGRSEVRLER